MTLDVSFEHVTIAKINRYLEVEEWRQIDLFDTYVQKLDHVLLYERVSRKGLDICVKYMGLPTYRCIFYPFFLCILSLFHRIECGRV